MNLKIWHYTAAALSAQSVLHFTTVNATNPQDHCRVFDQKSDCKADGTCRWKRTNKKCMYNCPEWTTQLLCEDLACNMCEWKGGKCQNRPNPQECCSGYVNDGDCSTNYWCEWTTDNVCALIDDDTDVCNLHNDKSICEDDNCHWAFSDFHCVYDCRHFTESDCLDVACDLCKWKGATGKCKNRGNPQGCCRSLHEAECTSNLWCEWKASKNKCKLADD